MREWIRRTGQQCASGSWLLRRVLFLARVFFKVGAFFVQPIIIIIIIIIILARASARKSWYTLITNLQNYYPYFYFYY